MYVKLENEVLTLAPTTIKWQGCTVNNPSSDKLTELGYKPLILTNKPDGSYKAVYAETDTEIIQGWQESEEIEESDDVIKIILGEVD